MVTYLGSYLQRTVTSHKLTDMTDIMHNEWVMTMSVLVVAFVDFLKGGE